MATRDLSNSNDRFKRVACRVLPCPGCHGEGKRAFEEPILLHALLHKAVVLVLPAGRVTVTLDIVPDDDDPHAVLAAVDAEGRELGRHRVAADFRLGTASATAFVDGGCRKPG